MTEVKNLTINEPAPKKAEPKPGVRTTEFWLALAVALGGAVATVFEEHPAAKIAGILASTLAAAGYGFSRAIAKR